MNKKTITIIITASCFVLIATVCVGLMIKNGIFDSENIISNIVNQKQSVNQNNNSGESAGTSINNGVEYPVFEVLLKDGAEYTIQYQNQFHNEDQYDDIFVKIKEMKTSKKIGDFDKCDDYLETKDNDGNILTDYTYVEAKVLIRNKGKISFLTSLNNLMLLVGEDTMYELRAYNSGKTAMTKDYYVIDLLPDKEYSFNLAYIVDDNILRENKEEVYLYTGFFGMITGVKPKIIEKATEQ